MNFRLTAMAAISGVFLFGSSMAFAGESEPVPYDWSGVYLGVAAGHGWGFFDQYEDTGGESSKAPPSGSMKGFFGGATLGYNYQINSIVLGVEADVQTSGIEGSMKTTPDVWYCHRDENTCSGEVQWFGTLRGRVGYAYKSYLPYVTAGAAYAGVESSDTADESVRGTILKTGVFGYVLGAGLEKAFSQHLTAKVEGLYVDLNEAETIHNEFRSNLEFGLVKVGLNWKF